MSAGLPSGPLTRPWAATSWLPRPYLALLGAVLLGAVFAGCGGDDDGGGNDDGGSTQLAVTPTRAAQGSNDAARSIDTLEVPVELADGLALGKPDAKATLQVFEDFQCPNCLSFTIRLEPAIMKYVKAGTLRFEFHNFPILGEESAYAAVAAVCAADQDLFWDYHKKLFFVQAEAGQLTREELNVGRFDPDALVRYAAEVGLDEDGFSTCLQDPATLQEVQADFTAARNAGLRGTPGFVLNGSAVANPGTVDGWRQLLDNATK